MSPLDTSSKSMILFDDKRPDSLFLEDLYDPVLHGFDAVNSGKIIGTPGSLVVDKTNGNIYYIDYVDPVTKKSYLKTPRILYTGLDGEDGKDAIVYLISYGNDKFYCYYDDRIKPTKLVVDSKLLIFGSANTEYRLYRIDPTGKKQIISVYLNSDEVIKGNRIPLSPVGPALPNAKWCTNCHTLNYLEDGEILTIEIFNSAGVLSAEFNILVKRAVILNDLTSNVNPIINFDATCVQTRGDEWFLYEKQSPSSLNITPYLDYYDGTRHNLVIDNIQCFMYGLEDFIPSFIGHRQKVLIKYFLNNRETTLLESADPRYPALAVEKWLSIVDNESKYGMKISIIPIWNAVQEEYSLKFFAYTEKRDHVFDVTKDVIVTGFVGYDFDKEQKVYIEYNASEIYGFNTTAIYTQNYFLTLRHGKDNFVKYIIKDTKDDEFAYGVEAIGNNLRRPVIYYFNDIKKYAVPTSVFPDKNLFVYNTYILSRPPFDPNTELKPLEPTHFTIRAHDTGDVIISSPIPIEEYHQAFSMLSSNPIDKFVGQTVICEFLQEVSDVYKILYGVPIDVIKSQSKYQGYTG